MRKGFQLLVVVVDSFWHSHVRGHISFHIRFHLAQALG